MSEQQQNGDNPNWKPFLDVLPESLHSIVKPVLRDWDAGISKRFQEIHAEYEPYKKYKEFVDNNVDFDYARNAVILADQMQANPQEMIDKINKGWNLGYLSPDEAAKLQPSGNDDDEFVLDDDNPLKGLENHPQFKQLMERMESFTSEQEAQRQREQDEADQQEFEEYLSELEQSYTNPEREGGPLPFDRLFVTALMNQGLDGEDAVKKYHEALAINVATQTTDDSNNGSEQGSTTDAPVVMGGSGSGSGTPSEDIKFGELSKTDVSNTVEQLIRQAAESGN